MAGFKYNYILHPFLQNMDIIFKISSVNPTLSQNQTLSINFLLNATATTN